MLNSKIKYDKADLEQKINDKAAETEQLIKTEAKNKLSAFQMNFDNKNNIEVSDLADQLENEEQTEIDNNHLSVPLSPGSSDAKSPTAAGSKKAPISRTMGVTSNLKQAEKNRLQRQQEEKRKKAE